MAETASNEPALPIPDVPDIHDLEKRVELAQSADPHGTDVEAALDPKASEEYTFEVEIISGDGRKWHGQFTNRILTLQQSIRVGMLRSQLVGGFPYASLDPETLELTEKMAHLQISLIDSPKWWRLSGQGALKNPRILNAVYQEVAAHERYFRGSDPNPEAGEGGLG